VKVFDLVCGNGHGFEGWFGSAHDYDAQRTGGLLACPLCESRNVDRRPSAPRLNLGAAEPAAAPPEGQAEHDRQGAMLTDPRTLQAALFKVAREIVARTEDVGERFAEEARRIHYDEVPERAIRGVASREEAQALAAEGIAVMPLPYAHLLKGPAN
jgi:hypothetical protein